MSNEPTKTRDLFREENVLSEDEKSMLLNNTSLIRRGVGVIATIVDEFGYAPSWARSKLASTADSVDAVADYMVSEVENEVDRVLDGTISPIFVDGAPSKDGDEPLLSPLVADAIIVHQAENVRADYGLKSNAKEAMENLPESTQEALRKKGSDHNDEYGDIPAKRLTNVNYLAVSYHRGIGAYNGNPESVRPNVGSAEQWAMGRVNGLLYALREGEYKRTPYDTDLLPKEHPLGS